MISGSYIVQQNYRKNNLIQNVAIHPALQLNLSSDFLDFLQKVAPDIGEEYFYTMDKIMFCKVCGIDINEALLYDHISSKEHKDIEKHYIVKCMTRCELCKK